MKTNGRTTRIEGTDTPMSALMKLTEGNPGALRVCMEMMELSPKVDPSSFLGPIAPLLSLDTMGIYESRIWMLYKDVCKQDTLAALACLRWVQLGLGSSGALNHAIDNYGDGIEVSKVVADVMMRLPDFGYKPAPPEIPLGIETPQDQEPA